MSLTDPAEEALDDARMTELTLTAGGIRRSGQSPDLDPTVAARVAKRLTDAWGWLPNEPEAMHLGTNFARSAYLLVAGTRTTPDHLLDALIDGPVVAAPTVKPGRDELAQVIYDAQHDETTGVVNLTTIDGSPSTAAYVAADAVLAILPGRSEADVRAETWDEGYHDGQRQGGEGDDGPRYVNPYRADEEAGK